MVLDLNYPERSNIKYEMFYFPDGTPHIKLDYKALFSKSRIDPETLVTIKWYGGDLMMLWEATDALRNLGARRIELFIPFFPGSRQDRINPEYPGEPLTARVIANLVNAQGYEKVTIVDPHSDVTPALIDNVRVKNLFNHHARCVYQIKEKTSKKLVLASPDAGAIKRTERFSKHMSAEINHTVLHCGKTRDVVSGKLSGFTSPEGDLSDKHVIIYDDVMSGGGTFLGLAEHLAKTNGVTEFSLILSHSDFGNNIRKTLKNITSVFDMVYTTNSIQRDIPTDFVNKIHVHYL